MSNKEKIESLLEKKFKPEVLEVLNESYKHAGHYGHDGKGESHLKIIISANDIEGNSRIEKHRAIRSALGEIGEQTHALQIELK